MSNKLPISELLDSLGFLLSGYIPNIADLLNYAKLHPEKSDQIDLLIGLFKNSSVSSKMKYGRDFTFAYGGIGVVVHHDTVVGNGVMIGQGVTIGGTPSGKRRKLLNFEFESAVPQIFDHVYIGAGARVVGAIDIGSFVIIQANAVVLHDVPSFSIVGGIPAKLITRISKSNCLQYRGIFHGSHRDFPTVESYVQAFPD